MIKKLSRNELLSSKYNTKKIETLHNSDEVQKYGVTSVPTVIIEKNNQLLERFTGLQSKIAYTNAINEAIK